MKKNTALALGALVLCSPLFVNAQDGGSSARHEIQVSVENVLNIFSPAYLFNSSVDDDLFLDIADYDYTYPTQYSLYANVTNPMRALTSYYYNKPSLALGYKFHLPGQALRFNLQLNIDDSEGELDQVSEYNSSWDDYYSMDTLHYKYNTSTTYALINLGYEHFLAKGKVEPYVGADLQYGHISYKTSATIPSSEDSNPYGFDMTDSYTIKRQSFSIVPFGGARIYFGPSVSVSTELRWTLMYYMDSYKLSANYSSEKIERSYNGLKTYFGPMGQLGINFHF
jgi:hypothetical protein